jgi:hypothetical protein
LSACAAFASFIAALKSAMPNCTTRSIAPSHRSRRGSSTLGFRLIAVRAVKLATPNRESKIYCGSDVAVAGIVAG